MHAQRYQWTTIAVGIAVVLTGGCRGTRPLSSYVQISESQDADLSAVDEPRQRLAINQPRKGSNFNPDPETASPAGDGAIESGPQRLATDRTDGNTPSRTRPASDTINVRLDRTESDARVDRTDGNLAKRQNANRRGDANSLVATQTGQASEGTEAPSGSAGMQKVVDDAIASMTEEEMAAAFESQPEHIKELAMRQLRARYTKTATKSMQPDPVGEAIAGSLNDTHSLPELTGDKPAVPAKRIAARSSSPADAPPAAKAAVMQTLSDRPGVDAVMPASAANSAEDKPLVAQASVGDLNDHQSAHVEETSAGKNPSVASAELASKSPATTPSPDAASPVADSSIAASPDAASSDVAKAANDASQAELANESGTATSAMPDVASAAPAEPTDPSAAEVAVRSDPMSDQQLYSELLKRLSVAVPGESEADRAGRLIKQRHLMVLAGNPDGAVDGIDGMSAAEQEYLRHQLLGLWTMVDPEGHPVPSRRFTTALPQIREATKFAAAATDSLDVRSLAFCTAIEAYGQIKTFPGNRFKPGQQVILYCEIENFAVTKTDAGFATHLQGSYDIYDANNEKIVSQLLPADKQVSANFLRDYFIAYQMHLPQQLAAGTYRLQLTMEDVEGKKYGQASIPLEIAK